jgi:hypothetical protein
MTRHPFDPSELDRPDADLEALAARLERYAAEEVGVPSSDLADRIRQRIDREPSRRVPWASISGWTGGSGLARAVAAAAVVVGAIVGAVAFGELIGWVRQADVGASPQPTLTAPPVAPSPTPTPTLSPSPTPSPSPSPTPASPVPSPSESEDDEVETPEPSESEDPDDDDNSGPGGGGNSGPGGGG